MLNRIIRYLETQNMTSATYIELYFCENCVIYNFNVYLITLFKCKNN